MVEDAGHELAGERREVVFGALLVEAVGGEIAIPSAEMQVATVASLIAPWFRREGSVEAVLEGNAADRFSIEDVPVGRGDGGRRADGKFLLAPTELGVVLLDVEALRLERGDHVVDHRGSVV